ncbi:hypothetical protein E5345_11680 [Propionibacterium sp. NM47_B9-13]|uniref:Uncharacterized protein n=1 Tax=Cutibacterium modestum HL044PA1 TaxID=765109 RepID=A0ABP2KEV8_9ACTN|nr:hypothetical protein HMPREF9621_00862 [Cutibacterium modestum HL037PA2]EFS93369.1 hypothetical protein HMPREF9607_00582 [Cutibacterium modestum HL044PA1]EFT15692.1 hypothetical protein HMPREF9622_01249 [Cutibacterium modestum HL037PA3]REB75159.1 hypothetical protein CP877_05035 [Cutibacterium modestum]TGY27628.1 hypothetical protein E5345_11680 [Propionibacterium sp. NM47_B9-13]
MSLSEDLHRPCHRRIPVPLDFLPVILDHLHRPYDTTDGTDPVAKRSEVPPLFASSLLDVAPSSNDICRNRAVKDAQSPSCLA